MALRVRYAVPSQAGQIRLFCNRPRNKAGVTRAPSYRDHFLDRLTGELAWPPVPAMRAMQEGTFKGVLGVGAGSLNPLVEVGSKSLDGIPCHAHAVSSPLGWLV